MMSKCTFRQMRQLRLRSTCAFAQSIKSSLYACRSHRLLASAQQNSDQAVRVQRLSESSLGLNVLRYFFLTVGVTAN